MALGDDLKAASTDALKKSATLLGVGLSLYGGNGQQAQPDDRPFDEELRTGDVRAYRGLAARCNCLGPDRHDALYAIKEGCRDMSRPTTGV